MGKHKENNSSPRIVNRKAHHDYHILDKLECGIELTGSEVKSIRAGQASLAEGFAQVNDKSLELTLHQVDIALYPHAGPNNHDPKRSRRLLAHKREIERLFNQTLAKKGTIVPLAMYFVRGRCKVEVGVGVGKHAYDKRQDIKKRDAQRDIQRGMTRKYL